ncbi:hypothetical protein [Clostridium ljungdahlii]|uniref:Uncharacterized protein n=1 Tax=Clostridium ljungdahlii (strain ATCC 55383 / DSM 13528 / PETC) TaxID=748727 RepID=D8GQ74_CLOLD|nr:hypothetical protein [Clostridium ljungdahlii]ADK16165.1 conserved hypothetical protein [Clostridium ljungdahlii DSM 13528]OAA89967.1 hypothetical protein WX45_01806 [Clostridium ljungdahlii DSM 13528]
MSLPRYVINFDELEAELRKDLLQAIDDAMKNKYPQLDIGDIEALLADIEDLLPDEKYKGLKNRIEQFLLYKYDGAQQVQGAMVDIPAIINDYKKDFIFDKDVFLTGLHLNQTGWKKEDRYSLVINKNKIIDSATTKEIGEHKYFNTYYKVNANTPVSFILHNLSGNSRQTLIDLEYIQGKEVTINPADPKNPDVPDIPNDWDIAVRMQWDKNSDTDMDLHGFMGDMHVCFWYKSYHGFYLNWDWLQHISNDNPEIISVKGHQNKVLDIYVHDYNQGELRSPVNVQIYEKRSYGAVLLKEYNITVENTSPLGYGVCSIDLKTKKITDMFTRKNIFIR